MKNDFPKLIKDLGMLKPKQESKYLIRHAIYECKCGEKFTAIVNNVKNGKTSSCGCVQKIHLLNGNPKHGFSKNPLYKIWHGMMLRCYNEKHNSYKNYGALGIKVCDEWQSLPKFIADMEHSFQDGLSIDRIDNSKGYSLDNCRWSSSFTQNQNTRIIRSNNTSGYRGVSMNKITKRWVAQIKNNLKHIHIGTYSSPLEAAVAYNKYISDNNLQNTMNVFVDKL